MISAFRSIAGCTVVYQDPAEKMDYGFDWSNRLEETETIVSSTWSADAGITLTAPQVSGSITSVFVSGGGANARYMVRNVVTTSGGRIFAPSIEFRIG